MMGFFIVIRNGFTRIFKNGKEQPLYFGKPMTGKALEILEQYYKELGILTKTKRDETNTKIYKRRSI